MFCCPVCCTRLQRIFTPRGFSVKPVICRMPVPPSRVLKSQLAGVLVACNVTLSCVALFNAVSFGRLITVSVEALPNSSSATGTATKSQPINFRFRQNDTDRNGYAGFGRPPADDDATVG